MIDVILGTADDLRRWNALIAGAAFRAIASESVVCDFGILYTRSDQTTLLQCRLLEKVLLAKQLPVSRKALVVQLGMAFAALQAFCVPCALQHLENEAVQDQFVAGAAFRYCCCAFDSSEIKIQGKEVLRKYCVHFQCYMRPQPGSFSCFSSLFLEIEVAQVRYDLDNIARVCFGCIAIAEHEVDVV